jgi:hypothetical protein
MESNAANFNTTRNVKSGKYSYIETVISVNSKTCEHWESKVDVITSPKFGTVSVKVGKPRVLGRSANKNSKCNGRKFKGLDIYYTSKKNFRGRDFIKVRNSFPGWPSSYNGYYLLTINVK